MHRPGKEKRMQIWPFRELVSNFSELIPAFPGNVIILTALSRAEGAFIRYRLFTGYTQFLSQ